MTSNLLEDAELAYHKFSRLEAQLMKETEELFKRRDDQTKTIQELIARRPNMSQLNDVIKKLSSLVDSSSNLVEEVCSKFIRIDVAKIRLQYCISKISDIHDLRSCKTGVVQAIERQNFEEAAMHIKRYLVIDQTELLKTTAIICGQDPNDPSKPAEVTQLDESDSYYVMSTKTMNDTLIELDSARNKLLQLCQDKFTNAIAQNDIRNVDKFFKIFPMLGEHKYGLVRYAEYIKTMIVTPEIDQILRAPDKIPAEKLGALFENIARLVDTHQPLIETYYGPGHMIVVIRIFLSECDRLSRKLLEEFRDTKKLQHITRGIQRASNPRISRSNQSSAGGGLSRSHSDNFVATGIGFTNATSQIQTNTPLAPELEIRNVDSILNEMSLVISRSEVFLNFLVQRMTEEVKYRADNLTQQKSAMLEIYQLITIDCELNYLVQEIAGIHVLFERFYIEESSRIAILTDTIDSRSFNFHVSSMLDDIFFIIKKCTKRAVTTKSNEVFCAIINHCVHLLDTTFCQYLDDKLKNQLYYSTVFTSKNLDLSQAYNAIQTSRYLQSPNELEMSKARYFSALNNLDRASDYIQTLRGILDTDIKKLSSPRSALLSPDNKQASQVEKSVTCLNELSQLTTKCYSIVNSALYQLFNATVKNRIKNELKTILAENPDLPREIAKNPEDIVKLARDLLQIVDKTLHRNLTPENYSKLISITKYCLAFHLKTPS